MTTTWDPLGSIDSPEAIVAGNQKLTAKFLYYQKHPWQTRIIMFLCALVSLAIAIAFYRTGKFSFTNTSVVYYIFALVPMMLYYGVIQQLQRQLTDMAIAKECGWIFDSRQLKDKAKQLGVLFPELLACDKYRKPDLSSQTLRNQFWGTAGINLTPFWLGEYQFSVGSGKNSALYLDVIYVVKLPHPATADFVLQSHKNYSKPTGDRDINTESIEFNKMFQIEYKGDRGLVGADIFQVLTPTAQEHLMDLRKATSGFTLIFRGDCMLIAFPGFLYSKYTNFLRKVAIDPRDITILTEKVRNVLQLAEDILPCID